MSWFLPIFTVTNPNKLKTRLVWDAAAKVTGTSLNYCLLKGPDTLASLMAVYGDIREMFHQVKVRREGQAAQKFLWRDGDSSRSPETYVMQVMTSGAYCSPALANYFKNRNAERFVADHPDAVKAICENTFVDDWLQSVDSESQMKQLAETVAVSRCATGHQIQSKLYRRWKTTVRAWTSVSALRMNRKKKSWACGGYLDKIC
ncbi:uncharacterized protein [Drosophila virilis]|uniref:uncharacterized protein n=1 Tax=Drosophila virilis TaxID=7244 RepID=UPI0038B37CB4